MTATRIQNGALAANAATVTFASRYNYVEVKNEDATAGNIIYARTDGTAPVSPWNDCYAAAPGERIMVPNDAPMWWQGFGGPGGTANPGTTVKLAGVGASSPFEVAGTG